MQDADYLVFKALAKILIRKGIITQNDVNIEAAELARYSQTASHNLEMLLFEANAPTASDHEADFRRRQMRERTAWLEKQAKNDGGKAED